MITFVKKLSKALVYLAAIAAIVVVCFVGSVDRTALHEQSFYHDMMRKLDTLQFNHSKKQGIKVGWGKYNITPSFEMPMAGYKPRQRFESIHDSLYVRIMAIDNGTPVFILSADLLLFPPVVKEKIETDLKKTMPTAFVFFSATHTHNGLGGWDNSLAGEFITGTYHDEWIKEISEEIVLMMEKISQEMKYGSISYFEEDATGYAANRLAGEMGKVDSKLRGLKIFREDSMKAILVTFSAHATSISKKTTSLSGDYPAALNKELEHNGYDFAMFAAGMVGSHRLDGFAEENYELTAKAGAALATKILNDSSVAATDSVSIATAHIPVQYGPSQLRIEKNWRLRDWAFQLLLRPLQGELTYLEIGDIILIGTPCDFSGELSVVGKLDSLASSKNKNLIITSFNGNYNGYITLDDHYDQYDKEEVRALNWVGPYFGEYYQEIIINILAKN
jgi:neutral ceramidase